MHYFSPASENNKQPILDKLFLHLDTISSVLEIGSGSGQHAIFFGQHFPDLTWRCSELPGCTQALAQNLADFAPGNVLPPVPLDVRDHPWRSGPVDCVYTANTLHIMAAALLPEFFRGIGEVLVQGGLVCIYGPLKYGGDFTTESNAAFDQWLRSQDPQSGIRDFETVMELAQAHALTLEKDYAMPAHNQFLVFRRTRDC